MTLNLQKLQEEKVLILDFGGQYKQLIGRRVREAHIFCEIKPYSTPLEEIRASHYRGIILTGGPYSVYEANAPMADAGLTALGIPIYGICYGAQWLAHVLGGKVVKADKAEYGRTEVHFDRTSALYADFPETDVVWMSHNDRIAELPEDFRVLGSSDSCPVAAFGDDARKIYGVQFHPEVNHTEHGAEMLRDFLIRICGCSGQWTMSSFVQETIEEIRERVGNGKVLAAFSGGVDSSVAALLVHRAVGKNLTCIFVDTGLMRKDEGDEVERVFGKEFSMNLIRVDARARFLGKLAGVSDPERKRKIIGEEFIRVFEEEAKKIGAVDFLMQGTIYPDVIESGIGGAVIKSHHNVGGLPEHVDFKELLEPLRALFKDEVREAGTELGLPESIVWRQPFPGPGLAVRILGPITPERVQILQEADAIFREEIKKAGFHRDIAQYFAVLTDIRSVGVMGDARTYDYMLALRAVRTNDFMTAEWVRLPYEVLEVASNRIVNEVAHINRVVYDITGKPPATIEWE